MLRLERHGLRRALVVSLPGDPDAAAVRDGIDARLPSPSIGAGAWLLTQLIAAVPLAGWTALFGLPPATSWRSRSPATPARLDVHAGWRLAAVNQAQQPSGPRPCSRSAIRTTAGTGRRPPGRPTSGSRPPAAGQARGAGRRAARRR